MAGGAETQHIAALPAIARHRPAKTVGQEVMDVVQGGSVSWQLGRQRGLGL